jgi:hypothetical protein
MVAVLIAVLAASCSSTPVRDVAVRDESAPPVDTPRVELAPVEVDPAAQVGYEDGAVTSSCFVYRAPDPSWHLVDGSQGCATGVAFGDDALSVVQVRAMTETGSIDEIAERFVAEYSEGETTALHLGGLDVVRAVVPWEGTGLSFASYVVAYPDSGLSGGGSPVTTISVTTMSSPEYEGMVAAVLESLTRPDGSPL